MLVFISKRQSYPQAQNLGVCRTEQVELHPFLGSAVEGLCGQHHAPSAFSR